MRAPRALPYRLTRKRTPLTDAVWWIVSTALILLGLAGTVLPVLPGTILVLGGIVLGAWIDGFTRVGTWTVAAVAVLAVLAWLTDYFAALLGAKRAGASRQAVIGAAIGEWLARRDQARAVRVGVATWIGILLGMIAKVVISFTMIGIFVVALLV